MAAPNIIQTTSIIGRTGSVEDITTNTSGSTILSNGASTDTVLKINTVVASNITTGAVEVSLMYQTAFIIKDAEIPPGATIALLGKDTPLYLEENTSLKAYSNTANAVDVIVSYEEIS